MRLPDDVFARVVGCDDLHIEAAAVRERRNGGGRIRLAGRVNIIPICKDATARPMLASVRDISHTGIGLLCSTRLVKSDNLLVQLPSQSEHFWVYCTIIRGESVGSGLYVVGARFQKMVEPKQARSLAG